MVELEVRREGLMGRPCREKWYSTSSGGLEVNREGHWGSECIDNVKINPLNQSRPYTDIFPILFTFF
jgi:hypothetical protein